jgi:hypothetical protein
MTKTCKACGRTLPTDEFYPRAAKCKPCTCLAVRANYELNRERYAEYERERSLRPERRTAVLEYQRTRRAAHPEKERARRLIGYSIRSGKIERKPCEVCGARAEAHHEDYSRPLDVRWLCFRHHREAHGQVVVNLTSTHIDT